VILVGIEVARYGLAADVAALIAKLNVRWASTLLAKSTIAEQTANFIGVYDGPHSRPAVKSAIENSDCLVALGCVLPSGYAALGCRIRSARWCMPMTAACAFATMPR